MKKFFVILLSAIVFGGLAGGTILGIQKLGQTAAAAAGTTRDVVFPTTAESESPAAETKEAASEAPAVSAGVTSENSVSSIAKASPIDEAKYVAVDVSGIVEASMPEVVAITNTSIIKQQGYGSIYDYFYGNGFPTERKSVASGSGVIIKETGEELLIVTNNHVIANASELAVTFIDGKTVNAMVKGSDSTVDIAVIAIPLSDIEDATKEKIKIASLHTEADLKCGQGVIAIGNALGYGQSVTVGVISALDREISEGTAVFSDLIQTDAAINPGNSGGALLNNRGELIGINVAKYAQTEVEGVGFSIPIYKVMEVIESLSDAKTKIEIPEEKQGRLGVYMNTVSAEQSAALNIPQGVMIVGFSDEEMNGYGEEAVVYSPAREAGLLKNDIVTKFDGQTVTEAQALSNLVKYYEAGSTVEVTVQRIDNGEYKEKKFQVTLGEKTETGKKEETKESAENETAPDEKKNEENGKNGDSAQNGESEKNDDFYGFFEENGDMYDFFRKFLEQYQ